MKQHKASRKHGSQRQAPRAGDTRKAAGRKASSAKTAARARATASKASTSKAAARKRAPVVPSGLVKLPAEFLIGSLDGLRAELLERLAIETPVSFDAASVERIDTAALQLLAAFTRDRRAAGRPVEWQSVASPMVEAASLLNLTSVLALDGLGLDGVAA